MTRTPLALLVCIAAVPAHAGENSFLAPAHVATWSFIQSAGGIRVGAPEKKENNSWLLPVVCDVSGLNAITQKPTSINSGLVVTKVLHRVEGNEILISVALNAPLTKNGTSRCRDIVLANISSGAYKVLYAEPSKAAYAIGTVTLR
jgi:hypothetical protein